MAILNKRIVDPILTTVVQGFIHPDHVGHHLFPSVPVTTAGGKVIQFGKESFKLYNTARAPGAAFKRVKFGYEGVAYSLGNDGLEASIPREHLREAEAVPSIDLAAGAVNLVISADSLSAENAQAKLARNANNYDASNKKTLSGTEQWGDYTNSDPVTDIKKAREVIRSQIGTYPTVLMLPALVFDTLSDHPLIIEKIKFTQTAVITEELLAKLFKVDKVVVGKAIAFDDNEASIDLWGKDAILAYVPKNNGVLTRAEPSYGYTYTLVGSPSVEVPYFENSSKSWIYGISAERQAVNSGISSGFLFKDVIA